MSTIYELKQFWWCRHCWWWEPWQWPLVQGLKDPHTLAHDKNCQRQQFEAVVQCPACYTGGHTFRNDAVCQLFAMVIGKKPWGRRAVGRPGHFHNDHTHVDWFPELDGFDMWGQGRHEGRCTVAVNLQVWTLWRFCPRLFSMEISVNGNWLPELHGHFNKSFQWFLFWCKLSQ